MALIAVLVLVACDAAGPELQVGYYAASTINGQTGSVLIAASLTCDTRLWRTSMSLAADGSFTLNSLRIDDCTRGGGGSTMTSVGLSGTWQREADRITFTIPGAVPFPATFDAGHISTTIPASAATFPADLQIEFTWYQVPPP